jgi:hypothetical protein
MVDGSIFTPKMFPSKKLQIPESLGAAWMIILSNFSN